jgi:vacuolar-type H+-ATPase subunit I/STV1
MMLGLTGYPIFEGVSRVVPALMESIKRPPIEKKAKEAAGVITGLAEAEERRKRAIEEETKKLEKIKKQREKLEKELEEKQKKLEEATKKEEEMKVWRLRAVVNELRARKERLERIERAKQEAIRVLAQRPTVTGEVQRSLETARETFKSIMEKLRRKK